MGRGSDAQGKLEGRGGTATLIQKSEYGMSSEKPVSITFVHTFWYIKTAAAIRISAPLDRYSRRAREISGSSLWARPCFSFLLLNLLVCCIELFYCNMEVVVTCNA